MTDRHGEIAHARAALSTSSGRPEAEILDAVHLGLLGVPTEDRCGETSAEATSASPALPRRSAPADAGRGT